MLNEGNYMLRFAFAILTIFLLSATYNAQSTEKSAAVKTASGSAAQLAKHSPAYAEILLRKTERESELEEFVLSYTEDFPKVKEIKFELTLLNKELNKILAVGNAEAGKLTLALGKLIVRKIEIETDLWNLRQQYEGEHPEVKRAQRKIEIYEKAVKEILP